MIKYYWYSFWLSYICIHMNLFTFTFITLCTSINLFKSINLCTSIKRNNCVFYIISSYMEASPLLRICNTWKWYHAWQPHHIMSIVERASSWRERLPLGVRRSPLSGQCARSYSWGYYWNWVYHRKKKKMLPLKG